MAYHLIVKEKCPGCLLSWYTGVLSYASPEDPTHPPNDAIQKLLPGRHLKVPLAKKNLFKKWFIPSAILILNAKF